MKLLADTKVRCSCVAFAAAVFLLAFSASGAVVQQALLKPSVEGTNDGFGGAIAISGNTIVVGAPYEASDATGVNGDPNNDNAPGAGAAYIFVREGTNWLQQAFLKGAVTWSGDHFGSSVAIFDNMVIIGVPGDSSTAVGVNGSPGTNDNEHTFSSGAVYIFVRSGTNWTQQAYLKPDNLYGTPRYAKFGHSVAATRDTMAVGAPSYESFSGVAFFYARTGTNWIQQTNFYFQSFPLYSGFGQSVAASGNTILVGNNSNDNAAFPFLWDGTNWIGQGMFEPTASFSGSPGPKLALNGDVAIVVESGRAGVFARRGGEWKREAELIPSSVGSWGFGNAVSFSENTVVVGSGSGRPFVFIRHGTNWVEQGLVQPDFDPSYSRFGIALGVSGQTLAVGADGYGFEPQPIPGVAYVFTGVGVGPTLTLSLAGLGASHLRINAIADLTYRLERAPSVSGPWTTNATLTAQTTGPIEFHDTNAPSGQAFYRVAQQ